MAERLDISTSQVAEGCTKEGQNNYKQTMFLFSGFCCCFVFLFVLLFGFYAYVKKEKEKKILFRINTWDHAVSGRKSVIN